MATTVQDITKTYPLPAYQYLVTIGEDSTLAFSEVVGLKIEYQYLSYADGLGWKYAPGIENETKITLKKGVIKEQKQLFEWINSIQYNRVTKKDITISLIANPNDQNQNALITWKLRDTFPISLEGPTFDASKNEVAIESLTLVVEKVTIEY